MVAGLLGKWLLPAALQRAAGVAGRSGAPALARSMCATAETHQYQLITHDGCVLDATDHEQDEIVTFRVRLPERVLDENIGDPIAIKTPRIGSFVAKGEAMASIEWEAYKRSASDELYHATWANAKGVHLLRLPFAARVIKLNKVLSTEPGNLLLDAPWIVQVDASREAVTAALAGREVKYC